MASSLVAPLPTFSTQPLPTISVNCKKLFRLGRHGSGEPYFGTSAGNRFDDPNQIFGTCYVGFDLATAVAETVLHDEMPVQGRFGVSKSDFEGRHLVRFPSGALLEVANFTDASLKTIVGNSSISTVFPYDLPQVWSEAVHTHRKKVDGIIYVSRQLNDRKAVVCDDAPL